MDSSRNWLVLIIRILIWALIGELLISSAVYGIRLRRWAWDITEPIRFEGDIDRGCAWGLLASGPEGYLNQYEKMEIEQPDSDPWLDYAPLRLAVMDRWGSWLRVHYPLHPGESPWDAWRPKYDYTAPVLRFNTALDAIAAITGFFLTWLWVRRGSPPQRRTHFRGIWQGIVAALLIWFNPAIILSSHGWPTWDSWIIPFFLLSALLASLDLWAAAGVVLGIGAMFKGQMLIMTPMFLLWPLIERKWIAALNFAVAMLLTFALIASPWLLSYIPAVQLEAARRVQAGSSVVNYPANLFQISRNIDWGGIAWVILLVGAVIAATIIAPKSKYHRWAAAGGVFLAALWPVFIARNHADWWLALIVCAALAAGSVYLARRFIPQLAAAVLGTALLLCMTFFHGSDAWWYCGFHFGTIHWPVMIMGLTDNLPGIFELRFGWSRSVNDVAFTLPAMKYLWGATDITSKQLFNGIFIVMLAIASLGPGVQARRRDRRFLVALVAPWLVFFTFPVQIHERYLLFAAGLSAICIGQSVGMALLGVFLTGVTWIMTINVMLAHGDVVGFGDNLAQQFPSLFSESSSDMLLRIANGTHPDLGWAVILCTLVFMWIGLAPTRRAKRAASILETPVESAVLVAPLPVVVDQAG